jgi:hypothetical protein
MSACAARGPPPLLTDVEVEDEDPVDVTTGTMLVTDAVPDSDTTDVVKLELPEELAPVDAADSDGADPAELVADEPPALLLLATDATKGLAELPPTPVVKSIDIVPIVLCT